LSGGKAGGSDLIPKSLSLLLKSAVVLFPLLAGGFLTFLGGERLYEASAVQVEKWTAPFGLLAFSSTQLAPTTDGGKQCIKMQIRLDMKAKEANVLQGIARCEVFLGFSLPSYDEKEETEEDVYFGVQFPFRVVNLRNLQLAWKKLSTEGEILIEIPTKDVNVSIVEENDLVTSVFYVGFIRSQTTERQDISLVFNFEWEDLIHREGFSTFTCTLPVALAAGSEFAHPYMQNPNARYVYHTETLGLTVDMIFPMDFEIKQAYPQIEIMRTETGSDGRSLFWEINAEPETYGGSKAIQLVSVDFEDNRLSETRSRLIFDSGLFMGLGIALILSGIHEAVRVLAEMREKGKPI
jgi:hypothetical protein